MRESIPARSWLHHSVEVRDSPIHGKGLFATADLPAATTFIELGGVVISDSELDDLVPPDSCIGLGHGTQLLIQADDPVGFVNHSCDPNLWVDGPLREVARRAITSGEELTVDYATRSTRRGWTMLCSCGSTECRVLISADDWKREDLQRRYQYHWNPQLLQRRDRANEW